MIDKAQNLEAPDVQAPEFNAQDFQATEVVPETPEFVSPEAMHYVDTWGLFGIMIIIALEMATPIGILFPTDAIVFGGGMYFSSKGTVPGGIWTIIALFSIAVIAGDLMGYRWGKMLAPKFATMQDTWYFKRKWITMCEQYFEEYGNKTMIISKFLPIRSMVPIVAGIIQKPALSYAIQSILSAIIWIGSLLGISYFIIWLYPPAANHIGLLTFLFVVLPQIGSIWYALVPLYKKYSARLADASQDLQKIGSELKVIGQQFATVGGQISTMFTKIVEEQPGTIATPDGQTQSAESSGPTDPNAVSAPIEQSLPAPIPQDTNPVSSVATAQVPVAPVMSSEAPVGVPVASSVPVVELQQSAVPVPVVSESVSVPVVEQQVSIAPTVEAVSSTPTSDTLAPVGVSPTPVTETYIPVTVQASVSSEPAVPVVSSEVPAVAVSELTPVVSAAPVSEPVQPVIQQNVPVELQPTTSVQGSTPEPQVQSTLSFSEAPATNGASPVANVTASAQHLITDIQSGTQGLVNGLTGFVSDLGGMFSKIKGSVAPSQPTEVPATSQTTPPLQVSPEVSTVGTPVVNQPTIPEQGSQNTASVASAAPTPSQQ